MPTFAILICWSSTTLKYCCMSAFHLFSLPCTIPPLPTSGCFCAFLIVSCTEFPKLDCNFPGPSGCVQFEFFFFKELLAMKRKVSFCRKQLLASSPLLIHGIWVYSYALLSLCPPCCLCLQEWGCPLLAPSVVGNVGREDQRQCKRTMILYC